MRILISGCYDLIRKTDEFSAGFLYKHESPLQITEYIISNVSTQTFRPKKLRTEQTSSRTFITIFYFSLNPWKPFVYCGCEYTYRCLTFFQPVSTLSIQIRTSLTPKDLWQDYLFITRLVKNQFSQIRITRELKCRTGCLLFK